MSLSVKKIRHFSKVLYTFFDHSPFSNGLLVKLSTPRVDPAGRKKPASIPAARAEQDRQKKTDENARDGYFLDGIRTPESDLSLFCGFISVHLV